MVKKETGNPEATPESGDKEKQEKKETELTPEELLKAIKTAGLEESFKKYVKDLQDSEADRRVTQAILTHDLKLKKEAEEAGEKGKAEEKRKEEQKNMNEEEKKISDLNERINKLTESMEKLTETTIQGKRDTKIKTALKIAGLDEGFSKYVIAEKDEDIETAVKDLQNKVLEARQAEIDKKLKEDGGAPKKGEAAGSMNEELIAKVASGKGTAEGTFEGKKLIEE